MALLPGFGDTSETLALLKAAMAAALCERRLAVSNCRYCRVYNHLRQN
jgi:hypothetical protein